MATLTGNSIASTYTQLLKLTSATLGADASAKYIEDGAGTDSALSISTTRVGIGTDSPDRQLTVKASNAAISIEDTGGGYSELYYADGTDSSGWIGYAHGTDVMYFGAGGASRFKVDANSRISLSNNDDGTSNTVFGYLAGDDLASGGNYNSFFGQNAGHENKLGDQNTAIGFQAMDSSYIDDTQDALTVNNTFIGTNAGGGTWVTAASHSNVGIGNSVMDAAMNGALGNTAVGYGAGGSLTTGNNNVFIGRQSGDEGVNFATGNDCTLVGAFTDTSGVASSNQIAIGYDCQGISDNSVTLGNVNVTDVYMAQDSQAYVHSQNVPNHVANTMSSPYYRFDGVDDIITVGDEAVMDDIFGSGGGSIRALIYPNSDGEDSSGNIVGKYGTGNAGWWVSTNNESGGFVAIRLYRYWSSTDLNATTSVLVPINAWSEIVVTYDDSSGSNDPIFYLNGAVLASSDGGDASGSAQSDDGEDLLIGGNEAGTRNFDGEISGIQAWNKILTATEVKELYSGASVPFKYKGANQTALITGDNSTFASGLGDWASGSNWNSQTNPSNNMVLSATSADERCYLTPAQANLEIGKRYRFVYDATSITGTVTLIAWTGAYTTLGTFEAGTGKSIEFTAPSGLDTIGLGIKATSSGDAITLDNLFLTQIGAVAEYDGSGASDTVWYDKSGNDLNGTVTGATLENKLDTIQTSGITFPATAHGSSNANTLDDYEEGTWDAVVTDGSNPMTMSTSQDEGYYTKIGNLVTVSGRFVTTSLGSASGAIKITGLPFTIANNEAAYSGGVVTYGQGLAITAGQSVTFFGAINETSMYLFVWDATTGVTEMQASEWTDDGQIMISFSYRAA